MPSCHHEMADILVDYLFLFKQRTMLNLILSYWKELKLLEIVQLTVYIFFGKLIIFPPLMDIFHSVRFIP